MEDKKRIIKLKEEIEKKREELNVIVLKELNKKKVLKFSQELDILIIEYTSYLAKSNEK